MGKLYRWIQNRKVQIANKINSNLYKSLKQGVTFIEDLIFLVVNGSVTSICPGWSVGWTVGSSVCHNFLNGR